MGKRTRSTIFGLLLSLAATVQPSAAKDVVIHAGKLIDGVSAAPRSTISIIVKDDRIVGVESGFVPGPAGAEVIDLSSATVLPGFIDMHEHLTRGGPKRDGLAVTAERQAIQSALNAQAVLLSGFTSVRDVGGNIEVLAALKYSIGLDVVPGPRLWFSGPAIGPTGGVSDPSNGIDPNWQRRDDWKVAVVDGPDEAIKAVRELHKRGAEVIKVMLSEGLTGPRDEPDLQMLRDDELAAIVATAHSFHMKVAAHAYGKRSIDAAVRAGVDSVEHATFADSETYGLMKQHGTFLVPTLSISDEGTVSDAALRSRIDANALNAWKSGVKIAFGTDPTGLRPHGMNGKEFGHLVKAGIAPMDAIRAATRNAAELMGQEGNIGTVQTGRFADIIAVNGDPLADITELERVQFVMKGGHVYKAEGKLTAAD